MSNTEYLLDNNSDTVRQDNEEATTNISAHESLLDLDQVSMITWGTAEKTPPTTDDLQCNNEMTCEDTPIYSQTQQPTRGTAVTPENSTVTPMTDETTTQRLPMAPAYADAAPANNTASSPGDNCGILLEAVAENGTRATTQSNTLTFLKAVITTEAVTATPKTP